jgi:hypothetical protein
MINSAAGVSDVCRPAGQGWWTRCIIPAAATESTFLSPATTNVNIINHSTVMAESISLATIGLKSKKKRKN